MRCKIPANDLHQRLDSTWCMYKGMPVYVRVDGSALMLYDAHQFKTLLFTINPEDPDFDISTPPLGYTQATKRIVVYVTREPRRRYKQGFDSQVMRSVLLGDKGHGYDINIHTKNMKDTMSRNYPSIAVAVKTLRAEKESMLQEGYGGKGSGHTVAVCISNDCAFQTEVDKTKPEVIEVWFKQQMVGVLRPTDRLHRPTVVVPSKKNAWIISAYLREFDWVVE